MQLSPIALFVYNRPEHTRQAVDALRNNYLAKESELFIFSDGPKDITAKENVLKIRKYIKTIPGFKKIVIIERENNFGLSRSIITGVSELTAQFGKVIVLEDDIVTSPYFLQFINDALTVYQDEKQVLSVCGYMYPLSRKYADTLFLRIADCWGWATWKRGWDLFMADGRELYNSLKTRKLLTKFNLNSTFDYAKMLKRQIQGENDSWSVRWYASAFLNGKLSLYPWKSLVMNIGFDGSGRHRGTMDYFKTELLNKSVIVSKIPILENEPAVKEIGLYLKKQQFLNTCNKMIDFLRKR